ncbi:nitroreductase family protein [Aerococcus urinae]|uniref:nitroreductase family protein n=1 Tax=Aerococcus urinae TaxID=1376 RepID=UPI0018A6DD32|nr:nitroreductase family protein [Aerococcus urinae]
MTQLKDLAAKRRSIYHIGKNTDHSAKEIVDALQAVLKDVPTAFNSQTSRIVIAFGDKHQALWDEIYQVQEGVLEGDMWEQMSGVIQGAKEGLGTILFFEDLNEVENMPANPERSTAYKENNNANHQYAAWLTLAELDLGATLQQFNIGYEQGFDKSIRQMFDLPDSYAMLAQMPFGSIETPAGDKDYIDQDEKVRVYE